MCPCSVCAQVLFIYLWLKSDSWMPVAAKLLCCAFAVRTVVNSDSAFCVGIQVYPKGLLKGVRGLPRILFCFPKRGLNIVEV